MMSYEQIESESRKARSRARRASKSPKEFTGLGHDAIRDEIRHIPFTGGYVSKKWKRVDAPAPRLMACTKGHLFVDSSGFGRDDEPALSVREFVEYVFEHQHFGYAIVESGQFQVVIATYVRNTSTEGDGKALRST